MTKEKTYDIVIVGAGPGGLAAGIKAAEAGKHYLIIEKGKKPFQGIIDSYPKGKAVYPTIPKGCDEPFQIEGLAPPKEKVPVEKYVEQIEDIVESLNLNIIYNEEFKDIAHTKSGYTVRTANNDYAAENIILAFGSNIPNDLGVYGEAKTVARKIGNVKDYVKITTLVIGGGNSAADIVTAISRAKREANSTMPVYWAHRKEKFRVNKDTARDIGEELLLGGQIRILQEAIPKIGEVDEDGIDRLYLHQSSGIDRRSDVFLYQGMSFPMKNVIACVGTQGPSAIFRKLHLKQVERSGDVSKSGSTGDLLLLDKNLQTNRKGIYAIGGSISPVIVEIQEDGTLKEKKHTNLIYTAIKDAQIVIDGILSQNSS
ncbi:MAG: NAD(P)-binding domain-containing protein [Candidatus Anammoxibacter sp.]